MRFEHQRHKPPRAGSGAEGVVVCCPPLRSNVNLSRIVRTSSCCGVRRVIVCGHAKIDQKIARDGVDEVQIEVRRTLAPVLRQLKADGLPLVGLEQTTQSVPLHEFAFPTRLALVLGHERLGMSDEILALLDHVVEIPVYGLPFSHNVATATAMALYEYCRQREIG